MYSIHPAYKGVRLVSGTGATVLSRHLSQKTLKELYEDPATCRYIQYSPAIPEVKVNDEQESAASKDTADSLSNEPNEAPESAVEEFNSSPSLREIRNGKNYRKRERKSGKDK